MKELILCKYGEIALKGLNKNTFESMLVKNVTTVEEAVYILREIALL